MKRSLTTKYHIKKICAKVHRKCSKNWILSVRVLISQIAHIKIKVAVENNKEKKEKKRKQKCEKTDEK